MSRLEIRTQIRDYIARVKFLRTNVYPFIDSWVRPSESRAYYRNHIPEFSAPIEVKFRQILLRNNRANQTIVNEIDQGLKDGKSFQDLARRYSQEFSRPEQQGQLWEKTFEELKDWVYPIPSVLASIKKGEPSRPFRSEGGIHYILLVDRVEGKPKPYSGTQDLIKNAILGKRREQNFRTFVQRLREKTEIEIVLPRAYVPQKKASDKETPPATNLSDVTDTEPSLKDSSILPAKVGK